MAKMNHGKSTIATFIKAILYGINKNKNGNEYSEFERYKPWDDGIFSGSMEYTIENDRFLVTREFKNNNTKIFKEDGEDISSKFDKDRTRGIDIGFEQLGVDEDTFENSVYIGQDAIGVNETSQSSILQKLSNIIQSGDEDISYEKDMVLVVPTHLRQVVFALISQLYTDIPTISFDEIAPEFELKILGKI